MHHRLEFFIASARQSLAKSRTAVACLLQGGGVGDVVHKGASGDVFGTITLVPGGDSGTCSSAGFTLQRVLAQPLQQPPPSSPTPPPKQQWRRIAPEKNDVAVANALPGDKKLQAAAGSKVLVCDVSGPVLIRLGTNSLALLPISKECYNTDLRR